MDDKKEKREGEVSQEKKAEPGKTIETTSIFKKEKENKQETAEKIVSKKNLRQLFIFSELMKTKEF